MWKSSMTQENNLKIYIYSCLASEFDNFAMVTTKMR